MGRARSVFKKRVSARTISITPAGWAYMTAVLVALLAAWNTGNNLYYLVLSVLLAIGIMALVFSRLNLRRLNVVQAYPETIYQNDKFPVRTTFTNSKRFLPSFLIETDIQAGTDSGRSFLLCAAARQTDSVHADISVSRRGRIDADTLTVRSRFPMGLFESAAVLHSPCKLLVYPAIHRLHPSVLELLTSEGDVPARRRGDSRDFYGIREYRPGDDSRLICWKVSAKHRTLLLREFERHEHRGIMVWFDGIVADRKDSGQLDMFEKGVSFCASLVWHYAVEGYEVGLVTPGGHVQPGSGRQHLHKLMEHLALIEPVDQNDESVADVESVSRRISGLYGQSRYVPVLVSAGDGRSVRFGPTRSATVRVVNMRELEL